MNLPQSPTIAPSPPDHTPCNQVDSPFSRMDYWWSGMGDRKRRGFLVMCGIEGEALDRTAQYSWKLIPEQLQLAIIRELGSCGMVAGLIRDATDEFRRIWPRAGFGGAK